MQVDEYIAKVDPKLRPQLAKLASTVRKALPEAAEAVRRGVPTGPSTRSVSSRSPNTAGTSTSTS